MLNAYFFRIKFKKIENRKEIQVSVRNLVIKLRNENKSYGEIAKIVNLSRSTVQTIVRNYNKNGAIENTTRTGRRNLLSKRDVSCILKEVNRDPKIHTYIHT